jgi:RNA polymerase primary sigma factor
VEHVVRAAHSKSAYFATVCSISPFENEQQVALFRRMNLLKSLAHANATQLNLRRPNPRALEKIEAWLNEAQFVRGRLVEANLRIVVSISRRLARPYYPFEEILGDANLLLLRAIDNFDYSRGFRFSTYATHVIRREVIRRSVKRQKQSNRLTLVLDERLREQPDRRASDPAHLPLGKNWPVLASLIKQVLDEREQKIIALRFGLEPPHQPQTRIAIGRTLGISAERARQLEVQAIQRLQLACQD